MWNIKLFVLLFALLACIINSSTAYKYLGIAPFAAKSHFFIGSALFKELARKGHDVTVITPYKISEPIKNYHEIIITRATKFLEATKVDLFEMENVPLTQRISTFHSMGLQVTKTGLEEPLVQALIHSNQTFDAVICEIFLTEAFFGFAAHFNVPLIAYGTFGATTWNTNLVGSPSPPSYVPHALLKFSDRMNFMQRIGNQAFLTFEYLFLNLWYYPKQEAIYKSAFPHVKPTMREVMSNTALVLLNQQVSISYPRPYMPNMVEVGGLHINKKRKTLPQEMQKFLNESHDGAIYFSMGSNLKSQNFPIEKRNAVIETFRKLKVCVLWKFEDPSLIKNKPKNVFISEWFPQDDVLAHPNVLAFITHGGLLSTTESIYHAKPVIGIPIFGDQFLNMENAVKKGYGIQLDYKTLSAPSFTAAIEKILNDPTYTTRVREISSKFRDQQTDPLDRAVFWSEHVVRQKGAKYLHNAGEQLNFIQYHNLDAIFILYGGIALILYLILYVLFIIYKFLRNLFTHKVKSTKKQKRN